MARDKQLEELVRNALAHLSNVEEKRMFRGITFMVDGKMCISAGADEIMCRIDPVIHQEALKRTGVRTVVMKGREYKGYVYVYREGIETDFDYWIGLALDFNKRAKAAKKKSKT